MAERIHIVLPDGTLKKLIERADKEGRSKSNLARKLIVDGLNGGDALIATINGDDLKLAFDRKK